jgi:hypothetical protein
MKTERKSTTELLNETHRALRESQDLLDRVRASPLADSKFRKAARVRLQEMEEHMHEHRGPHKGDTFAR